MSNLTNPKRNNEHDARRDEFIIEQREAGKTYEEIGNSLVNNGFPYNVAKARIMQIIRTRRPDLLGTRKKAK